MDSSTSSRGPLNAIKTPRPYLSNFESNRLTSSCSTTASLPSKTTSQLTSILTVVTPLCLATFPRTPGCLDSSLGKVTPSWTLYLTISTSDGGTDNPNALDGDIVISGTLCAVGLLLCDIDCADSTVCLDRGELGVGVLIVMTDDEECSLNGTGRGEDCCCVNGDSGYSQSRLVYVGFSPAFVACDGGLVPAAAAMVEEDVVVEPLGGLSCGGGCAGTGVDERDRLLERDVRRFEERALEGVPGRDGWEGEEERFEDDEVKGV
ncbi:hypothetical protein DFH27DRAFT_552069 [Peziza echinospora]|nr:hypothetical protein DFH27DRAFT_552069 [Peziza echinospora]